jgi:hypothetical protein
MSDESKRGWFRPDDEPWKLNPNATARSIVLRGTIGGILGACISGTFCSQAKVAPFEPMLLLWFACVGMAIGALQDYLK